MISACIRTGGIGSPRRHRQSTVRQVRRYSQAAGQALLGMMRIIFRKEAEADLRSIIAYYEELGLLRSNHAVSVTVGANIV